MKETKNWWPIDILAAVAKGEWAGGQGNRIRGPWQKNDEELWNYRQLPHMSLFEHSIYPNFLLQPERENEDEDHVQNKMKAAECTLG